MKVTLAKSNEPLHRSRRCEIDKSRQRQDQLFSGEYYPRNERVRTPHHVTSYHQESCICVELCISHRCHLKIETKQLVSNVLKLLISYVVLDLERYPFNKAGLKISEFF